MKRRNFIYSALCLPLVGKIPTDVVDKSEWDGTIMYRQYKHKFYWTEADSVLFRTEDDELLYVKLIDYQSNRYEAAKELNSAIDRCVFFYQQDNPKAIPHIHVVYNMFNSHKVGVLVSDRHHRIMVKAQTCEYSPVKKQ